MGGWREDLQGKQRRDSLQLDRDVFVTTNYGQVQGFKVRLYDDPGMEFTKLAYSLSYQNKFKIKSLFARNRSEEFLSAVAQSC